MDTRVQPRDVILIHIQDEAAFYARVEEILPDRKVGWRQMRFQVLTLPLQEMTWILEPSQIDGEPFTMGGTPIRIERLPDPGPAQPPDEPTAPEKPERPGELISFPPQPKK
jgi:hypothetical protein